MSSFKWVALLFLISYLATGARLLAEEAETEAENNPAFHAALLKIAAEYKRYGRVDDEMRWAPYLCRMPMPSIARFSKSEETDTHGQKLYFLFAKDRNAYIKHPNDSKSKVGQVVVKESWLPKETTQKLSPKIWEDIVHEPLTTQKPGNEPKIDFALRGAYYPYATKEGKTYHASELSGLYIMYKTEPKKHESDSLKTSPTTDEGWVYGTVTADGKTVTSAGRVESCMSCHQDAENDRLFGLIKK